MKNLKNTVAAAGLAAVLMMSATSAQAGLLVSDRATIQPEPSATTTVQCTEDTSFYAQIKGIIVVGLNGLLVSDAPIAESGCQQDASVTRAGLLVSD